MKWTLPSSFFTSAKSEEIDRVRGLELATDAVWIGDLERYPSQLRARRGDTQIDLSLRDVKILQHLLHRKGKVVDLDSRFNHCWGRDYFPDNRTLDQHISKLRKRIERDQQALAIIATVHGVGCRYDELGD